MTFIGKEKIDFKWTRLQDYTGAGLCDSVVYDQSPEHHILYVSK